MKRQFKKLVLATATVACLVATTQSASACGGRGGISAVRAPIRSASYGGGYQGTIGYSAPARQVYHSQPRYQQPSNYYPTPSYPQASTYSQPVCQTQAPIQNSRIINSQPVIGSPARPTIQSAQPVVSNRVAATSVGPQPARSAPANTIAPTNSGPQSVRQPATSTTTEVSALQMLQSLSANPAPQATPAAQPQATIPQFTEAKSTINNAFVGSWKVNLSNDQVVQLDLGADGKFTWTATNKGSRKSFAGQYRLENDRLTLVRSNDLQQMNGSWKSNGQGFVFKLDGSNNSGLNFGRVQ